MTPADASEKLWRDELEQAFATVATAVEAELGRARELSRVDGARDAAEGLNQTIRRLRKSKGVSEALAIVTEASARFCTRAAALVFEGSRVRVSSVRGVTADADGKSFEASEAAAVMAAIESKDPVVASAEEGELSPDLHSVLTHNLETRERAYLFPVIAAGSVSALLVALGQVQAAPLELLAEAAGMRIEAESRPKVESALVTAIQPAAQPVNAAARPKGWDDLSGAEQAAHLRAQRFARVKVAQMRLERTSAVREGQERGDLYAALKPEIDAAREEYRKQFESAPAMVDYLYLELVRSLANDEDRLLGPGFPGRLF